MFNAQTAHYLGRWLPVDAKIAVETCSDHIWTVVISTLVGRFPSRHTRTELLPEAKGTEHTHLRRDGSFLPEHTDFRGALEQR